MRITGQVTPKRYRCCDPTCRHERTVSTNHYGKIYDRCLGCGWKKPMELGQPAECIEPLPEGWGQPEDWGFVKLGDIAEFQFKKI